MPNMPPLGASAPPDQRDLALLRFFRCLVRWGLSFNEAQAVVSFEIKRIQLAAAKKRRRKFALAGPALVSWIAEERA